MKFTNMNTQAMYKRIIEVGQIKKTTAHNWTAL